MRTKIYIFSFLTLGLIGINLIVPIYAASTQWFPDVGTTIEYDLSNSLTLMDYSRGESETFNIYDFEGNLTIIPTYMDSTFPAMAAVFILTVSNSRITFLVNFTEKSSTELYRNTILKVGDAIYTDMNINFIITRDAGYWSLPTPRFELSSNIRFVEKSNFFTSDSSTFLDYFDCTLGEGASILPGVEILKFTPNHIIAAMEGLLINQTYEADRSGKVQTFSMIFTEPQMLVIGHRKTEYIFTARDSTTNGSIPGFNLYLIFGLIGILTVVLIRKRKNIL